MNDMQKLGLFLAKMALRLKKVEDGLNNAQGGSTTPDPDEPQSTFYRYAKAVDNSQNAGAADTPAAYNATFYRFASEADTSSTA